ncbi:hypothetical protein [Streptomyces sp. NPDC001480]|uniref:hypothetical protein n=1 Tax=Streptomyces sp. NPDC001480 TaxID=3364577 RepID=UPI003694F697
MQQQYDVAEAADTEVPDRDTQDGGAVGDVAVGDVAVGSGVAYKAGSGEPGVR